MADFNQLWNRLGIFIELVERSPSESLGRTAAMKYAYILQTVKDVPLNYNFRLYTYGPFDSQVLSDLDYAKTLGVLTSEIEYYSSGYKYNIRTDKNAVSIKEKANIFLEQHMSDIKWVLDEFGEKAASELELISTIICVGQYLERHSLTENEKGIVQLVKDIKPRFTIEEINKERDALCNKGIISSCE